jgi:hypothetical protein
MNPWNESFKNESFKNESFKKCLRNESTKRIHETNARNQYGFANPKPRIRKDSGLFKVCLCKDSLDSWKQVESFENKSAKRIHKTNLLKTLRFRDPRYETNPDLFCKARIKSFWSQDSWLRYKTNPWIRETNPRFYESLIRFPHPYVEPLSSF